MLHAIYGDRFERGVEVGVEVGSSYSAAVLRVSLHKEEAAIPGMLVLYLAPGAASSDGEAGGGAGGENCLYPFRPALPFFIPEMPKALPPAARGACLLPTRFHTSHLPRRAPHAVSPVSHSRMPRS